MQLVTEISWKHPVTSYIQVNVQFISIVYTVYSLLYYFILFYLYRVVVNVKRANGRSSWIQNIKLAIYFNFSADINGITYVYGRNDNNSGYIYILNCLIKIIVKDNLVVAGYWQGHGRDKFYALG